MTRSYLEVVVLAVFSHPLQVGVGVQEVLSPLRDLGGDQRIQVSRHNVSVLIIYVYLEDLRYSDILLFMPASRLRQKICHASDQ